MLSAELLEKIKSGQILIASLMQLVFQFGVWKVDINLVHAFKTKMAFYANAENLEKKTISKHASHCI